MRLFDTGALSLGYGFLGGAVNAVFARCKILDKRHVAAGLYAVLIQSTIVVLLPLMAWGQGKAVTIPPQALGSGFRWPDGSFWWAIYGTSTLFLVFMCWRITRYLQAKTRKMDQDRIVDAMERLLPTLDKDQKVAMISQFVRDCAEDYFNPRWRKQRNEASAEDTKNAVTDFKDTLMRLNASVATFGTVIGDLNVKLAQITSNTHPSGPTSHEQQSAVTQTEQTSSPQPNSSEMKPQ